MRLHPNPEPHWLLGKPRTIASIPPQLRAAIRSLVAGERPWPLFVFGPAGIGKTCAALCLLDHAHGGFYFTAESLCETLNDARDGNVTSQSGRKVYPGALWQELATTRLVVLDEIGSRDRVSDFHFNTVKRVLDCREGKPLVCLTNLGMKELSRIYDDRVTSRLASGTAVAMDGKDRRLTGGEL